MVKLIELKNILKHQGIIAKDEKRCIEVEYIQPSGGYIFRTINVLDYDKNHYAYLEELIQRHPITLSEMWEIFYSTIVLEHKKEKEDDKRGNVASNI